MVILLFAVFISPAAAEPPPLQLAAAQRQKPATKPVPKPAGKPAPDDFDLLPREATPDPAALARQQIVEQQLAKRRTMLQLHQLGGFLTLASLTTTVVLGQLDYLDKYGGGGDTGSYHAWHRWMGVATACIFAGTASLAVFAPVPIEKKVQLDTATLHKIAMTTAAAGMAAEIVRDFALAHQIIGYTTLAAAATGFTVLTF